MTPERAEASRRHKLATEALAQKGLTRESRRMIKEEKEQAKEDYKRALEKERG